MKTTTRVEPGIELLLSIAGTATFLTLAVLGWAKLKYGFNFIDEGMYMTDGWRLAAGDRLFPDSSVSAVLPYVLFNAAIFKVAPEITLLGFREIQFWGALFSMIALGVAVHGWTRTYWPLPFALAILAFTGLDPIGMSANLSYYTYPHLFLSLHIAGLLFAMQFGRGPARSGLMMVSGIFLWAAGASALYLTVTVFAVVLLWILLPPKEAGEPGLSGRDVAFVLAPVAVLWSLFLLSYRGDFITAVLDMLRYTSEDPTHVLFKLNPRALPYFGGAALILGLFAAIWRLPLGLAGLGLVALSALALTTVRTNSWGLIDGYWRGWFSAQMWAASFLAAVVISLVLGLAAKRLRGRDWDVTDRLIAILAVPTVVFAAVTSLFSGMGVLTVLHVGIPAALAGGLALVRERTSRPRPVAIRALALGAVLVPFCYPLARADWKFTYFDLSPEQLTHTLPHGFAKGIVTNGLYAAVIDWMERRTEEYSRAGDLAITMDEVPMGYMIIKRRPALNHSWTGYALSDALRADSIAQAIDHGRDPKIAFRFVRAPLFFPQYRATGDRYALAGVRHFPAHDPISNYLFTHMKLVDTLRIQDDDFVEFYVRPGADGTVAPVD